MGIDVDATLTRLAAGQHGVFTLAQARAAGVSSRALHDRVRAQVLLHPHEAVFRWSCAADTWHAQLLAAVWAGGSRGVASHRSAAELWGLAGGNRRILELTCPRWRRARHDGLVVHEMRGLASVDVCTVDGIPVTGPELTLLHLGAVRGSDTVEMAYELARHAGLVTWESCDQLLRRYARSGRPGVRTLREVMRRRDASARPTESEMETLALQLIRRVGLPEPVTQHEVRAPGGAFLGRLDLAWPERRVGLEYQSLRHHASDLDRARDRRRLHRLRAHAWDVLEIGPDDVRFRADEILAAIRTALRAGLAS